MAKFSTPVDAKLDTPNRRLPAEYLLEDLAAWSNYRRARKEDHRLPQPLPLEHAAAAEAWIKLYQPSRKPEEPIQKTTSGEIDPYITRLRNTLMAFLRIDNPAVQRAIISAIRDEHIEYRGDSPEIFEAICRETAKYRALPKEGRIAYTLSAARKAASLGFRLPV